MIEITPQARQWIQKKLSKRGCGLGIYIDVIRSGCSGYSYGIDFVDEVLPTQKAFDEDGFVIVVDEQDMALLSGLTLRLEQKGLNQSLAFNNPQATAVCGCGTSFSID